MIKESKRPGQLRRTEKEKKTPKHSKWKLGDGQSAAVEGIVGWIVQAREKTLSCFIGTSLDVQQASGFHSRWPIEWPWKMPVCYEAS